MSLNARIERDYIAAYKAKDALRLSVLRLVKTAAKNMLVELKRPGGELTEAELCAVLVKQSKQRQDSIEQFRAASRHDLADKEEAEQRILQDYLPKPLSQEELDAAISAAIAETGATSPKDMGRVMQKLTTEHAGRVDGKILSALVRARLAS
ncbi:MAG: GatB/YqeY domain-containing protein [Deltaproteobacteria bacterium]|jgi:uncharacterized protein YqeY|nr:GatB/YqeY domain-containing protein [Deltaproteobacteria bacterium]